MGDAAERFLASMEMDYEKWHDGTGYDLQALCQIPPAELNAVESVLINHQPQDWRDIEALAQIESPRGRAAVEAALKSSDPKIRQEAMRHVSDDKVDDKEREKLLLKALKSNDLYDGLSDAIDEAAEFHPPAVIDALLKGALKGEGEVAVHFAALLYYIHGKAQEPFDWDQRPFFLRFNTADRAERAAAFTELCQTIGADVKKYLN